MKNIKFRESDHVNLDLIQPLWEKLNEHHLRQDSDFRDHYENFTFPERKEALLKKSTGGSMFVCLAEDKKRGILVGYSVITISPENQGEIDSIYVEDDYRLLGIGDELIKRSLQWMDRKGVKTKKVVVAASNQDAASFYERYGFRTRSITLEQASDK
jgi:diamine N-acetyltransferase